MARTLNFDVLLHILCDVPAKSDLFHMMQTCHGLYTAGLPLLLHELRLRSPNAIASFAGCMRTNQDLLDYVRVLRVDLDVVPRGPIEDKFKVALRALTWTVRHARKLEVLFILEPTLLDFHAPLRDAIREMPALKQLSLGEGSAMKLNNLRAMLINMQSPPTSLSLHFSRGSSPPAHAPSILEPLAPHLEELRVGYAYMSEPSLSVTYPRLRVLELWPETVCDLGDRFNLAVVFPNLKVLKSFETLDTADVDDIRASNQETLRAARWQAMDRIHGSLLDIYLLGLDCPATTLHINRLDCADAKQRTEAVVRDLTPTNLSLAIDDDVSLLPTVLRAGAERLERLVIKLTISEDNSNNDPTTSLDTIAAALSGLKLTYLRVHVLWYKSRVIIDDISDSEWSGSDVDVGMNANPNMVTSPPPPAPSNPPRPNRVILLVEADLQAYAHGITQAMPSLEHILVEIAEPYAPMLNAFYGMRDAATTLVSPMTAHTGLRVKEKMESVWTEGAMVVY